MVIARSIGAARFVVFVAFLDLFIQFPVVAPLAKRLGASDALVGLIVAVYSLTNLVGNVGAGWLLDRWGRKWPVLLGLVASAVALAAYALAQTAEQLVAVRAVHGLTTAVLTPGAFAMLGDVAAADRRARVMGVSGAIIAVAAVLGPPLAGVTRDRIGVGAVFIGGAVLMAVAALVFALAAVEPAAERPPGGPATGAALTGGRPLWLAPRLLAAYLGALALTIGLGTLVTHLPLALEARGQSASVTGLAFTIYALVAMVVMAGPLNRLGDRYDRIGPLGSGLALIGGGMLVLGVVGGLTGVALGMAIFGFGFGLLFPAATALVAEAAGRAARGIAFGLFYAVYSAGVVIGALLSGLLDDRFGTLTALPFLVGGLVALIGVPLVLALGRRLVPVVESAPR